MGRIYFKIEQGMFERLVDGKEVIIPHPDGSQFHFTLEDMGYDAMYKAIEKSEMNTPSEHVSTADLDMMDKLGKRFK